MKKFLLFLLLVASPTLAQQTPFPSNTTGTANAVPKFTGPTTPAANSSITDDGVTPTRAPNGLNTATAGNYTEWTVDAGGVTANKLACRSSSNKAVICPTNTTTGVLGVAQATATNGQTVQVCWAGKCNVISSNATTAGHFLIPSTSVAGDVDDTGATTQPGSTQSFLAESSVSGGSAVLITVLSPDNIGAASAGIGVSGTPAINQIAQWSTAGTAIKGIDFPDVKFIPAANCNNTTGGNGWSIGSGGSVTCRAGTNNLGGFIAITDTAGTFATFQVPIPEDWDSANRPFIRFQLASTDATNGHTIIPEINVACYKGDGTTTDDVAPNGFHSLSTVTLNGNANRFWSTANVQMNSTDMTNCVAGALMQITVGRATDTATQAAFYGATVTFPRLLVVQAN